MLLFKVSELLWRDNFWTGLPKKANQHKIQQCVGDVHKKTFRKKIYIRNGFHQMVVSKQEAA